MTLACIIRLMPATPIADSSAPIVVGIRQTSNATSVVTVTAVPALATSTLKIDIGSKVTTTTRKTIVSATRRMLSAISFGVFCRRAPSTIAIMRSRNDSPALTLTRTTSQSESTRVPPVTEAKSPPASRITGADSPVIALSSTEATPSITSPSSGTMSSASIRTTAPFLSSSASCGCQEAPCRGALSTLATTRSLHAAQAGGLGLAAAFGERLGEVGEQHREPQPDRDGEDEASRRLALARQGLEAEDGGQDAADIDDEHHRVAPLHARVELGERLADGRAHEHRVEERERDAGGRHGSHLAENSEKCSATGPRASAGT